MSRLFKSITPGLILVFAIALSTLFQPQSISRAASEPPGAESAVGQSGLQPITAANAKQITQLSRIGNGTISVPAWSPDGKQIAIGGSLGVWLFPAKFLGTSPPPFERATGERLDRAFKPGSTTIANRSRFPHNPQLE